MSSITSCGNRVSAMIAIIVGALGLSQTRSTYWLDAGPELIGLSRLSWS